MTTLREKWRIPRLEFSWRSSASDGRADSPVGTYYLIAIPAIVLTVFGLIMGFSASAVTTIAAGGSPYSGFIRQLAIIVAGFLLAVLVQKIQPPLWYRGAAYVFVAALFLQLLVLTPLATEGGGNTNWVKLPGFGTFQPSEFLKFALIVFLGRALSRPGARLSDWRQMVVTVGLPILGALADVMLGRDMGTAMVVAAAAMGVLWVGGLPKKWFIILVSAMLPAMAFLVALNPTRLKRIMAVLPWNRPVRDLSAPEQIDHAMWALGAGGLTGLGPGASREKWNYLQAAHTDFILAIIGEEFGLLGTLTIIVALGVMLWGMVRLCQNTSSLFHATLTGGVMAWIGIQAVINIMSVTGLGPVIGVPLPLVSYGGSSYWFTAMGIALVLACARIEAGMSMWGAPVEGATGGRDPRLTRRRRSAGKKEEHR